eukprot:5434641-Pyramimonas_sp.AAC.1
MSSSAGMSMHAVCCQTRTQGPRPHVVRGSRVPMRSEACRKELLAGRAAFLGSGVSRVESTLRTAMRVRDNRRTARDTRQAGLRQVSCRVGGVKQLPIFPLNMVGLPDAKVTLHIFEARRRHSGEPLTDFVLNVRQISCAVQHAFGWTG